MRQCDICDKGTTVGVDSTHNYGGGWARRAQRSRKTWKPNLRKARIKDQEGKTRTIRVCMKCYKALRKDKYSDYTLVRHY